jgi:hypothetical protein
MGQEKEIRAAFDWIRKAFFTSGGACSNRYHISPLGRGEILYMRGITEAFGLIVPASYAQIIGGRGIGQ